MAPSPRTTPFSAQFLARGAALILAVSPCSAFSACNMRRGLLMPSSVDRAGSNRVPSSPTSVLQIPLHASRTQAQSRTDSVDVDFEEEHSYPVQIHHQGHVATINVRENEPILQALERQSTTPDRSKANSTSEEKGQASSLALSQIPNECRRGNCLTCSSRIKATSDNQNILANVDNGLSPTVASELTKSGYVLTCCSYVTGPGVVLELDQNDEVWDTVYRKRLCDEETTKVALEAQARLLRRVNEENVGKWKMRMEENWDSEDER